MIKNLILYLRALPKKIRWIIFSAIILFIAIIVFLQNSQPKITYKEFPVKKQNIQVSILATGTVQPENRLEIKAPIAGRIDKVLVQEGENVKKAQIIAWMSSTERAALLDTARSKGQDELRKWENIYLPTPIIAPLAGMIIRRNIEPGQTITNSDAILVMSNRLTIKAQVDETDLAKIKLKQTATITLDAYPDSSIPGTVDQIAYEAKTVNNVTTYTIDVLPQQPPEYMRSGMTANVNFLFDNKEAVLSVPNEALSIQNGSTKVLLKSDKKIPEEVTIETGVTNGKITEVVNGLKEGDIVMRTENQPGGAGGKNPFSPFNAGKRPNTGAGSNRR